MSKCGSLLHRQSLRRQYRSRNDQYEGSKAIELAQGWSFHKLEFKVSKGASGQIRLMYLVNTTDCVIKLVWIYSHEQFEKRPTDVDLKSVFQEILDY